MDGFLARENIKHYKQLLEADTDPGRRKHLLKLLADEQAKLDQAEKAAKGKGSG